MFFNVKSGATPLYVAAFQGEERIVQILLEKGKPNVDLADQVILLFVSFFFQFLILFFLNVKYGATPLFIAAKNGHEQIVQLLLEKGNPNVDLATKVIVLIVFFFFFFFRFLIFLFFLM